MPESVVSMAKLRPFVRCSSAALKTSRAAAIGKAVIVLDCRVLPTVSGSRIGISENISGFQRVSVDLPEPFAPAMNVTVGRFNGTDAMRSSLDFVWRESRSVASSQSQVQPLLPGPFFVPFPATFPYRKHTAAGTLRKCPAVWNLQPFFLPDVSCTLNRVTITFFRRCP